MDILHGIETKALALRDDPPTGAVMVLAESAVALELPMERPLFNPAVKPLLAELELETGEADIDAAALYAQVVVDKARLARNIRQALQDRAQVSLRELIDGHPLQLGLAELVAYLQLGSDSGKAAVDEAILEPIGWQALARTGEPVQRQARLHRVIFVR
jgi:hypothetical protein